MQSAGDLLRNIQDTNDTIEFSLKNSIQYHVQKKQRGIRAYLLDDGYIQPVSKALPTKRQSASACNLWTCEPFTPEFSSIDCLRNGLTQRQSYNE